MRTPEELLTLGFFEEEFSYDWHTIKKNDCELSVTTEYDLNNVAQLQVVAFNGEKLQEAAGTKFALEFLIKLM